MKVQLTPMLGSQHHSNGISSIALSHSNKQLITVCRGGKFQLWNVETRKRIGTFEGDVESIPFGNAASLVKFSLDDQYVVTGSSTHTVTIYSTKDCNQICTCKGHTDTIWCVDISSDNRYAVAASSDRTCKLWDVSNVLQDKNVAQEDNIGCIRTFEGHTSTVKAVCFTRDVKHIVTGSYDKTLILWCVESGNELRTFRGHSRGVLCLSVSSDDKCILSGSINSTAILWDLENGEQLNTFKGHTGDVRDVSISSDNKFVVSASCDKSVKMWDCKTGINAHTLTGHESRVTSLALSCNDMLLFTGSQDKTIKMLDLMSVPDIPGMAWQTIRPFIMLRFLMDKKRAVTALVPLSSSSFIVKNINNNEDDQVVDDVQKKYESYSHKQQQMLQSFMMIDADDMFRLSLSFCMNKD